MAPLSKRCFVGFDGFIDTICHLVRSRESSGYARYETLKEWSDQVALASGKSANFELEVIDERLGGNAMILAQALASLGHEVNWCANVGSSSAPSEPSPVFEALIKKSERWANLGIAGRTQALEFHDGKLLMGIQGQTQQLSPQDLEKAMGANWVQTWLMETDFIAMVNWTMTLHMGEIWDSVVKKWLQTPASTHRPFILIDLADPKKRSQELLKKDLLTLSALAPRAKLLLALNRSEAEQVAALWLNTPPCELKAITTAIHQHLPWHAIILHDLDACALAGEKTQLEIRHERILQPKVSTGGGDHFNAGLAHSLLAGCTLAQALAFASQFAGEFIRQGFTPTREQAFLPFNLLSGDL